MPLIKSKSKKAMSKNIAAEMDAGKPQDQSVAIAYDIMRKARRKKMAQGGGVKAGDLMDHPSDKEERSNVLFDGKAERIDPLEKELQEDEDADDIVGRIMRKMRRK